MLARHALFLLLVLLSPCALAQGGFFGFTDDYGAGTGDVGGQEAEPRWRFALGAGGGTGPNFQGSDKYKLRALPFVVASYGRFFVGFGGVGVRLYRDAGWSFGAILAPGQGRKEDVDQRLAGLGDVDRTVNLGMYGVNFSRGFATRAVVYTDVGGDGHGTLARLDVLRRFRVDERLGFFAGPGLTWASRQYMQSFFGVTEEQAARSGFPEFHPGSAVNSLRLTGGASYRFAPDWRLIGSLSASRLSGDAGNSPIVETRAQVLAFVSAIYLFR
jgi:outer membrane protein